MPHVTEKPGCTRDNDNHRTSVASAVPIRKNESASVREKEPVSVRDQGSAPIRSKRMAFPSYGRCFSFVALLLFLMMHQVQGSVPQNKSDYYYEKALCEKGLWGCTSEIKCIEMNRRCDHTNDCAGGEDEKDCLFEGLVPCYQEDKSIKPEQVCDGTADCDNGTDERENCCGYGLERDPIYDTCVDIDECASSEGTCSQHCLNTDRSFECSCDPGYQLTVNPWKRNMQPKKTFCMAQGPLTMIISKDMAMPLFSTLSSPWSDNTPAMPTEKYDPIPRDDYRSMEVSGQYNPQQYSMKDVDFDVRERKMFWCVETDPRSHHYNMSLWSADLSEDFEVLNSRIIVEHINCDNIKVDWINKLIFFTSHVSSAIEVTDYKGKERRAIIWQNISKSRAVDVDPTEGLIFYTDWGVPAHLGRADMDGGNRMTLLENNHASGSDQVIWPNAMVIDHPNKNIYWMDANLHSIECISYEGKERYTITKHDTVNLGHPYKMQIFEDMFIWRDLDGKVSAANKFSGDNYQQVTISSDTIDSSKVQGITLRLFHPSLQPMSEPRCKPGLCSKLCLPVPGGHRCACSTGYRLYYDGYTCNSEQDDLALVALEGRIMTISLFPMEPLPTALLLGVPEVKANFWAIDYHYSDIFFNTVSANPFEMTIKKMSMSGKDPQIVMNEHSAGGLSIDWVNERIYWAQGPTVSVGDLDGKHQTPLLQKEGFDFGDILVDPCQGHLYLAARGMGIYRVSSDGSASTWKELVVFNETKGLNGISFDKDGNKLFFGNGPELHRVNLDSETMETEIIVTRPKGTSIISTDIWDEKVIWTERRDGPEKNGAVLMTGKLGTEETNTVEVIREGVGSGVAGIKVRPRSSRVCKLRNPCEKNSCSHLCLQGQAVEIDGVMEKTKNCTCPTGYALLPNSTTECADDIAQYLVYNPESGIQTVSLDTEFLTPMKDQQKMGFRVKAFDIDAKNNLVYYCFRRGSTDIFEYRGIFSASPDPVALPIYTTNCKAIAVEWVTRKLYIVDAGEKADTGLILVVDIERPHQILHMVVNLQEPLDVVVHPSRGRIYWILASHNIMSTSMHDSSDIEQVVAPSEGSTAPLEGTQLFIDYATDSLYWTENVNQVNIGSVGMIKRVNLLTKEVETMSELRMMYLNGVAKIDGNIYYSSMAEPKLYRRIGFSTSQPLPVEAKNPFTLRYSQSQSGKDKNPCGVNNGGCSHFCFIGPGGVGKVCGCPSGQKLRKNSVTCDPLEKALFVATKGWISVISLGTDPIDRVLTAIPDERASSPDNSIRSIDIDIRRNILYWSEINPGAIWSHDMNTGQNNCVVSEGILKPVSVAVDWNANNLFWVDYEKGTLEVMSLTNRKRRVISHNAAKFHRVVVDSQERDLFVSYVSPQSKVVVRRMWLDGSHEFDIEDTARHGELGDMVINDLAIDIGSKRLYWASTTNIALRIASSNYGGRDVKIISDRKGRNTGQAIAALYERAYIQSDNTVGDTLTSYTVVKEFDYTQGDASLLNTYTFQQLRGKIVSMKAVSRNILGGSVTEEPMCKVGRCKPDEICIPSDVEALCKCGDNDTACSARNVNEPVFVPNTIPRNNCPENYCHSHGTCTAYKLSNNSFTARCDCEDGYSRPRCDKKSGTGSRLIEILIVVAVIVVIIIVIWFCHRWCRRNTKGVSVPYIPSLPTPCVSP